MKVRLVFAIFVIVCIVMTKPVVAQGAKWYKESTKITHAAGQINGLNVTNTREALEKSLQKKKVIEMDFNFTSDGVLVCKHDWGGVGQQTLEVFQQTLVGETLHGITAEEVIGLLHGTGTYLVVDAKANVEQVYTELVRISTELGYVDVLKHIIPQIYSKSEYKTVNNIYQFKDWIFTVYRLKPKTIKEYKSIAKFCKKNGIKVVTMPVKYAKAERIAVLKKYGLLCFVHTVNDKKKWKKLKKLGVYGIYTDSL